MSDEAISGTFRARATSYAFGTSAKKETPQCAVMFEITDGPHAGKRVSWYGYFTEKTAERTVESLQHCGWQGDDVTAVDLKDLANEVEIVVEAEPWESDSGASGVTSRVRWVNSPGRVAIKPMAAGEQADFRDRMKGLVHGLKQKKAEGGSGASFDFGANRPKAAAGAKRAF